MNIKEIAKKAGVSIATVSRAINPDTRNKVASHTLERIEELIKKYGYTPHIGATNLSGKKTKMIGLILPYTHNIFYSSYYSHILSGISNFFIESDYQFKIILLHEKPEKWDTYDFKIGEGVEGLILTHWFRFFSKERISKINVPCIILNDFEDIGARFICENGTEGGAIAAKHLYELGHRNIAIIAGDTWSRDSQYRIKGFQDFWKRHDLPEDSILVTKGSFDDKDKTQDAVDHILKTRKNTTAIFCCNDNMAFWAIEKIRELGLKCPKDISVMGYDDDFRSAAFTPALTTVCVPLYDLAQKAAKYILGHLKSDKPLNKFSKGVEQIPVKLVQRDSTCNPLNSK